MTAWKEEGAKLDEMFKGRIQVNGKDIDEDYILKDGDKIVHETVREETPVIDILPDIL